MPPAPKSAVIEPVAPDEPVDPPLPSNPTDQKEFDALKDDGTRFRIVHTVVGGHTRGAIVGVKDFGRGADLQRLKDLGAIAEAPSAKVAAAAARAEADAVKATEAAKAETAKAEEAKTEPAKAETVVPVPTAQAEVKPLASQVVHAPGKPGEPHRPGR